MSLRFGVWLLSIMNILIANNRYFISGGPERYLFGIKERLEKCGHRVIVFSNRYAQNCPSPYQDYFMPSPVQENAVYFREFRLTPWKSLELLGRASYSFEAKRRVERLIQVEKPDIAYLLAIANYISPSVIDVFRKYQIPVVMRLSDYNLVCPAYNLFRDGQVCQECLTVGLWRAIQHRCLQGSRLVSLARVVSMSLHRIVRLYDKVDLYIAPSKHLLKVMQQAGIPSHKLVHLPSFVEIPENTLDTRSENMILYVGRLSPGKGVEILIRAFGKLKHSYPHARLVIAGEITPEGERLQALVNQYQIEGINFVGYASKEMLAQLYQAASFSVVPSLWFDNTPMSVYESQSYARAVIASRIGSLPEQVIDGVNGLLFDPGDPEDLKEKMAILLDDPLKSQAMGQYARERLAAELSPERHLEQLTSLFQTLVNGSPARYR